MRSHDSLLRASETAICFVQSLMGNVHVSTGRACASAYLVLAKVLAYFLLKNPHVSDSSSVAAIVDLCYEVGKLFLAVGSHVLHRLLLKMTCYAEESEHDEQELAEVNAVAEEHADHAVAYHSCVHHQGNQKCPFQAKAAP